MNIIKGIRPAPAKVVVYGVEGIGKSTLGSKFPKPLFLDLEGGTSRIDVDRIDIQPDYALVKAVLNDLCRDHGDYYTLVIDTADKLDGLIIDAVCRENNKPSLDDFGYARGYLLLEEKWRRLLDGIGLLQSRTGMGVVFLAHQNQRKIDLPENSGSYDHYEMKLQKRTAAILKEWPDFLIFLKYDISTVKDKDGKNRATGGARKMYTQHTPLFDAKTRAPLPSSILLDDNGVKTLLDAIYPQTQPTPAPKAEPNPAPKAEPKPEPKPAELPPAPEVTQEPVPVDEQLANNAGCNNENAPISKVVEQFTGQFELIQKIDDALTLEGMTRGDLERVTVAFKMRPAGTPLENFSESDLKRILGGWAAVSNNMKKLKEGAKK